MNRSGVVSAFVKMLKEKAEKVHDYNCNWSKFDLDKHIETYINYLEVCIDENGVAHYATPSHQRFLENVCKRVNHLSDADFLKLIEVPEAYDNYLLWLCTTTKHIAVWNDFIVGVPNEKQKTTLRLLSQTEYKRGSGFVYSGSVDFN